MVYLGDFLSYVTYLLVLLYSLEFHPGLRVGVQCRFYLFPASTWKCKTKIQSTACFWTILGCEILFFLISHSCSLGAFTSYSSRLIIYSKHTIKVKYKICASSHSILLMILWGKILFTSSTVFLYFKKPLYLVTKVWSWPS